MEEDRAAPVKDPLRSTLHHQQVPWLIGSDVLVNGQLGRISQRCSISGPAGAVQGSEAPLTVWYSSEYTLQYVSITPDKSETPNDRKMYFCLHLPRHDN